MRRAIDIKLIDRSERFSVERLPYGEEVRRPLVNVEHDPSCQGRALYQTSCRCGAERAYQPSNGMSRQQMKVINFGRPAGLSIESLERILVNVATRSAQLARRRYRRALIALALALAYAPIVGFVVRSILCLLSLI